MTLFKPITFRPLFRTSRPGLTISHCSRNGASLRRTVHNQGQEYQYQTPHGKGRISLRPLLFGLATCVGMFWVADNATRKSDTLLNQTLANQGVWSRSSEMAAPRKIGEEEKQRTLAILKKLGIPQRFQESYSWMKDWYTEQDDSYKATIVLIALNALPFLAWRIPAASVQRFMMRNFLEWPGVNPSYTMLTSVFSHQSLIHFGFNMIALYGFGPLAFTYLKEKRILGFPNENSDGTMNRDSTSQFVAFFATCGLLANVAPHYVKQLAVRSSFLMRLPAAGALTPGPGLGASGAGYSVFAICALAHPQMSVVLVFLPMFPIAIGTMFPVLVAGDLLGVLCGWTSFGHLTHLTGAAVGVGAYHYGAMAWYKAQCKLRTKGAAPISRN